MAAASPLEVTRDIVVALISRPTGYIGSGSPEAVAKQVAEVFEVIHTKVLERYIKE